MDNQSSNESIGRRVAELRKQKGWTQLRLAEEIGTVSKHISEIERGVTGMSIDTQIRLGEKLYCSMDYLLKGQDFASVDYLLPGTIVEILRSQDLQEIVVLTQYLEIYEKIRKMKSLKL